MSKPRFKAVGAAKKVELVFPSKKEKDLVKAIANKLDQKDLINYFESNKQEDLLYFKAVYATEGFNLNDDVFDRNELWAARRTPLLKPVNISHVAEDIVGTIYAVEASTIDGLSVPIEQEQPPQEPYEIAIYGVIYQYNFSLVAMLAKLKSNADELYVSMEAWFSDFDYAVANKNDSLLKYSPLTRDDKTIEYDKSLKAFGGNGVIEDKKIGRMMRDIVFAGVGFVDNPANPRSKGKTKETEMSDLNTNIVDSVAKAEHEKVLAQVKELTDVNAGTVEQLTKVQAEVKENLERIAKSEEIAKKAKSVSDAILAVEQKYAQDVTDEDFVKRIESKFEVLTKKVTESEAKAVELATKASEVENKIKESLSKIAALEAEKTELEKVKTAHLELVKKIEDEKVAAAKKVQNETRIKEVAEIGLFNAETLKSIVPNFIDLGDSEYNKWLEEKKLIAKSHVKPENKQKISLAGLLENATILNDVVLTEDVKAPAPKEVGWTALAEARNKNS